MPNIAPERTVALGPPTLAVPQYPSNSTANINYPTYGQTILVKSLKVFVRSAPAFAEARTVTVYTDPERTNSIATFSLPVTAMTNSLHDVLEMKDVLVPGGGTLSSTSGLYLTVSCPNDAPTMVATLLVNFTSL